ncbi:rad17 [[Candida] subhashii]|uniref:Rad17 n=1 Tax=[Candida] subhashii TaxID=561895 RepID=A0A8J5UQV8_9ASCO|nr:rad17 [[Candida] subhashii]KAG7664322.1 rad17 [[Candida] subhashii]
MSPKRKKPKYTIIESSFEEIEDDTDEEVYLSPRKQQSPIKQQPSPIKSTQPPPSTSAIQWVDKYAPLNTRDICINPTKLSQVKSSLSAMIKGTSKSRILILTGPSGSSKSTTIKLLAKELIPTSSIFQDPVIEYFENYNVDEFLNDCRYKIGSNLSVVLFEELPNVYHHDTLMKFRHALMNWIYYEGELPPLVICLSEIEYNEGGDQVMWFNIENNLTVDTLLGKELSQLPQVEIIKFNSIATMFLKKTVNRIIKLEDEVFRQIPKTKLNAFLDEMYKVGDIRSMIFNLQMWTIFTLAEQEIDGGETINLSPNFIRENQINLFYAIGKIIYSSSNFASLSQDNADFYSVEQVLSQFPTNLPLLNLSLLENYHIFRDSNYPIEIASNIVNDLSLSDMSTPQLQEIGIRSTRINLRKTPTTTNNVHSTYKSKIKFPRHFKMIRMERKTMSQIKSYQKYIAPKVSFSDLNLIDGYYLPMINNRKYPKKLRYGRLGGRFCEIYADEDLPIFENHNENGRGGGIMYEYDQFQADVAEKINQEMRGDNDGDDIGDEGYLSDPIEDSEAEKNVDTDEDGFSSDPELDILISQGRI